MCPPAAPPSLSDPRPDFRHVTSWIFDLDNTLYSAGTGLFGQIDSRMSAFVARHLGVSLYRARAIQKEYYREHGTTLSGLMRIDGLDPEDYLAYVHDVDLSPLSHDPLLECAIARLPGRRFIFTNGCRNHAARVLHRLALTDLFDEIWDIRTVDYCAKPDIRAYRAVLERVGAAAGRAAMFDDAARNLVPAHALGMTTVWLKNGSVWSKQGPEHPRVACEHIRHETDDLRKFLDEIRL